MSNAITLRAAAGAGPGHVALLRWGYAGSALVEFAGALVAFAGIRDA